MSIRMSIDSRQSEMGSRGEASGSQFVEMKGNAVEKKGIFT